MEIKHIEKGGRGAFLIKGEDGNRLAEAVEYAREKELKIFATCPFAIRKLTDNADYADVFSG